MDLWQTPVIPEAALALLHANANVLTRVADRFLFHLQLLPVSCQKVVCKHGVGKVCNNQRWVGRREDGDAVRTHKPIKLLIKQISMLACENPHLACLWSAIKSLLAGIASKTGVKPSLDSCVGASDMVQHPFRWNRVNIRSYDARRKPFDKSRFAFHHLAEVRRLFLCLIHLLIAQFFYSNSLMLLFVRSTHARPPRSKKQR
jgi:hypothetical protein